jgi:hypothetical protein
MTISEIHFYNITNIKPKPFRILETRLMDDFYDLELETGEIISPLIYSKSDWNERHSITALYENIQKEGLRIK